MKERDGEEECMEEMIDGERKGILERGRRMGSEGKRGLSKGRKVGFTKERKGVRRGREEITAIRHREKGNVSQCSGGVGKGNIERLSGGRAKDKWLGGRGKGVVLAVVGRERERGGERW